MSKNPEAQNAGKDMIALMEKLWPLNRSITGNGLRETLEILKQIVPSLNIVEVKTGSKVLDWVVPQEWELIDAYLKDPDGNTIASLEENNLHIVGYSTAVNKELDLEELLPHLHSLPDQPEAIPYVTSYYKKNWGFCISEIEKQNLKKGKYKAYIDAKHFKGSLSYGELIIPGKSEKEIFISTYCCHPSMANNELSGPVVSLELAKWISSLENLNYTYRFVFIPEMIGSATYLEFNRKHLTKNVIAGFNLTCVGDDRAWSFLPSRSEKTYADKVAEYALDRYVASYDKYEWKDRGSDESMYCAPGIDLPVVSVMRSKYGTYPEYHTSFDTIGRVVTEQGLQKSFDLHKQMITIIESDCFPLTQVLGEPQLGPRGLYPMLSKKGSTDIVKTRLDLISYADGNRSLLDISMKCQVSFEELLKELKILVEHQILKTKALWN